MDSFPSSEFAARQLPRPAFSRPREIRGLVKHVRTVAWSCDGRHCATGGEYKEVVVWDQSLDYRAAASLPSANTSSPHSHHVGAIAWSPSDPTILVTADKTFATGSVVAVWDITSASSPIAIFKTPGDVINLAFHPSGRHFAAVYPMKGRDVVDFFCLTQVLGKDTWLKRDDITLGGFTPEIGSEELNSLRFINSGELVCAVSNDGTINAWIYPVEYTPLEDGVQPDDSIDTAEQCEAEEDDRDREGGEKGDGCSDVSTPDDSEEYKEEAVEGDVEMTEGDVKGQATPENANHETMDEPEGMPIESNANGVPEIAETDSRDDTQLPTAQPLREATPPADVTVEHVKRRAKSLTRYRHASIYSASLLSLSFDPRGRFLVTGGQDALLTLYDTKGWMAVKSWDVFMAAIRHTAFSYDGEYIAVGGDDLFIAILSVYTGQVITKISLPAAVNALSWHPKKNTLAYCHQGKIGVPIWYILQQE
nr:hypothetical protein L204_04264 [Cryptococcus depauperatus CBS 7855]